MTNKARKKKTSHFCRWFTGKQMHLKQMHLNLLESVYPFSRTLFSLAAQWLRTSLRHIVFANDSWHRWQAVIAVFFSYISTFSVTDLPYSTCLSAANPSAPHRTKYTLIQVWYILEVIRPAGLWLQLCSIWWNSSSDNTWHFSQPVSTALLPAQWSSQHLYIIADIYQAELRERYREAR